MSLHGILTEIGKGFQDLGSWIDDGLKVIEPIVAVVDPPAIPLLTAIEAVLESIPGIKPTTGTGTIQLTADQVQAIVKAIATLQGVGANVTMPKIQ